MESETVKHRILCHGGPLDGRIDMRVLAGKELHRPISYKQLPLLRGYWATAVYAYDRWVGEKTVHVKFVALYDRDGRRLKRNGAIWPERKKVEVSCA